MAEGSSSPEAETDTAVHLRLCDVKKETVENFQTILGSIANSQESPGPSGLSASHLWPQERKLGALLCNFVEIGLVLGLIKLLGVPTCSWYPFYSRSI